MREIPNSPVVSAPRKLDVASPIERLSIRGKLSSCLIPITVLVIPACGHRTRSCGNLFSVLISSRLPDSLSNKCELAIESPPLWGISCHTVELIYTILISLDVRAPETIVDIESSLELAYSQNLWRRADCKRAAATRSTKRWCRGWVGSGAVGGGCATPSILVLFFVLVGI